MDVVGVAGSGVVGWTGTGSGNGDKRERNRDGDAGALTLPVSGIRGVDDGLRNSRSSRGGGSRRAGNSDLTVDTVDT